MENPIKEENISYLKYQKCALRILILYGNTAMIFAYISRLFADKSILYINSHEIIKTMFKRNKQLSVIAA